LGANYQSAEDYRMWRKRL